MAGELFLDLASELISSARTAEPSRVLRKISSGNCENELLFFFKPEVFLPDAETKQIIDYTFERLSSNGIGITGATLLSGPELERLAIMDAHYGYINAMSRRASTELSESDLSDIRRHFQVGDAVRALGGHEVLSHFPEYSASSLDKLWASKQSVKIRSGLYAEKFELGGTQIIIVNGFHPEQLAYFTQEDRKIALLVLQSNLPWRFLRTRILGDTFPEKALPGTLRRQFFDHSSKYGLGQVSIANNCAHMSAGPFEAAYELNNFFGRMNNTGYAAGNTNIAKRVIGSGLAIDQALANPTAELNGKVIALFDATEETDTTGAVELFRRKFSADNMHA